MPVGWSFTVSLADYDSLDLGNLLAQYEAPPAGYLREEVEKVKICFSSHNFMTYEGGPTNT